MEVSQYALAWMLGCCAVCGACFAFAYDLLRWIRPWSPRVTSASAVKLAHRLQLPPRLRWTGPSIVRPVKPKLAQGALYGLLMLQDILFCLSCAVALTLILYATNDGQMRLSAPALFGVGWGLYSLTLGTFVRGVSCYLFVLLRAAAVWSAALLIAPIRLSARLWMRWTAPLRKRVVAYVTRCKQSVKAAREQRAARKAALREARRHARQRDGQENAVSASRQPNGKHYFSTRQGGSTPTV